MEKNIYKNLYSNRKNLGCLEKSQRIKKMLSIIDRLNLRGKNVLDIGCYDGAFLSLIENRGNFFFGLDASDWAVSRAQEKGLNVQQYFFDDQVRLPFEDNFFDVIIAGEIIEHIYDTDFFLQEISRILKPGGRLLVSTPNIASLGRRIFLLLGLNPIIEVSPNESDSSGHIRYFTFKTLQQLLGKHKLKVIFSQSDCINFSKNGKIKSVLLAELFPALGASIICYAKKSS